MIEIYHFFHPLCSECLQTEKEITALIKFQEEKTQLRLIPLLNLTSFQHFIEHHHSDCYHTLSERNHLFTENYSCALDYKSVELQSRKKSAAFLFALQERVCLQKNNYSPALVKELLQELDLDIARFETDRQSDFIRKLFQTDQKISREMAVTREAATVFFNYSSNNDFGLLTEEHPHFTTFEHILQRSKKMK